MPSRTTRAIAIAASAAFLATSVDLRMASAGSAPSKAPGQELGATTDTDFSARKKRYRRGGGNAAAFAAIAGTIGAIAAAQAYRKRHRYYDGGYYYGGPVYYGAPRYYGGHAPYSYAPHYYSGPRHGWHGRYGPPATGPQTQSPGHL